MPSSVTLGACNPPCPLNYTQAPDAECDGRNYSKKLPDGSAQKVAQLISCIKDEVFKYNSNLQRNYNQYDRATVTTNDNGSGFIVLQASNREVSNLDNIVIRWPAKEGMSQDQCDAIKNIETIAKGWFNQVVLPPEDSGNPTCSPEVSAKFRQKVLGSAVKTNNKYNDRTVGNIRKFNRASKPAKSSKAKKLADKVDRVIGPLMENAKKIDKLSKEAIDGARSETQNTAKIYKQSVKLLKQDVNPHVRKIAIQENVFNYLQEIKDVIPEDSELNEELIGINASLLDYQKFDKDSSESAEKIFFESVKLMRSLESFHTKLKELKQTTDGAQVPEKNINLAFTHFKIFNESMEAYQNFKGIDLLAVIQAVFAKALLKGLPQELEVKDRSAIVDKLSPKDETAKRLMKASESDDPSLLYEHALADAQNTGNGQSTSFKTLTGIDVTLD